MKKIAFAVLIVAVSVLSNVAYNYFIDEPVACAERGELNTCNPKCGACSVNVTGNWTYFRQGRSNAPIAGPVILKLKQTGNRVINTNTTVDSAVTFVGTVFGNSIDFSLVVSGEESEGYVDYCQGHVLGNKFFAICNDRDSIHSSITANKG